MNQLRSIPDVREVREERLHALQNYDYRAKAANNTAASPKDDGGDLELNGRCNESGSETVGHNPTPDQSMVEKRNAVGVT